MSLRFRILFNQRCQRYRIQYKTFLFWYTHGYTVDGMSPHESPTWEPHEYTTREQAEGYINATLKHQLSQKFSRNKVSNRWHVVKELA